VVIVEFALLGDVRAWRGGRDVDLGTPGQRAMLALLLLGEGRQICIEELIDRMWGADPPPSARVTARTYISRLRRSLAEAAGADAVIESTAGGYCLPGVADRLDLAVFQRRTEAARVGENTAAAAIALRGALELWRGTALSGAHGVFVEQERERLEQLRLAALEERITLELELGQHAVLVAELSGLANAHPMRERAHELLMLSLYRAGRQADALAAYQNIRILLAEKLGIDPGPSLRALHHQILRSAPELAAPRCPAPLRLAAPGAATSPVPAQLPPTSRTSPAATSRSTGCDRCWNGPTGPTSRASPAWTVSGRPRSPCMPHTCCASASPTGRSLSTWARPPACTPTRSPCSAGCCG